MRLESITWTFICQAGRLEREACVLAASLRKHLGDRAKLVATLPHSAKSTPTETLATMSSGVREFLHAIGVQIVPRMNPLLSEASRLPDLLMNKAYALGVDAGAEMVVFMDSDQLCHAVPDLSDFIVPFYARNVFYTGAAAVDGLWDQAYEICEGRMPSQRIVVRSKSKNQQRIIQPPIVSPPYFNSGFQAVHQRWIEPLVRHYVECYRRLMESDLLGDEYYFTEQVALAIAVAKSEVPYQLDSQRINQSFRHYYSTKILAKLPKFAGLIRRLCQTYPLLEEQLEGHDEWREVLASG